ncbi:hypothetical protein [Rodentibacter haemolyticus]|uniref:Uncharacterized protein n=1 Tax=Rodentibacter haemolyticus TaxID=2778911 RepID=A0ABX6V3B1_9PAST|nr:hypothetical protein [Rodentibacter haemolyticus]QPB42771.1 hypothetical protein IHV77_01180 [Rodentibacter haemolyticus]
MAGLASLLSILNTFRKEIPDSIGYEIYPRTYFTLPKELREYISNENQEIYNLHRVFIRIDNYSLKSRRNIRVIYSGGWQFSPDIQYRRRENTKVKYKILDDEKEIIIEEILPNESVYIILYGTNYDFNIEQILFDDSEVTKTMQLLTEAKRDPELARMKLCNIFMSIFAIISILLVIGLCGWNYIYINKVNRQQALIDNAVNEIYKNVSGGCYIGVYETKEPKFNEIYAKNKWNKAETLYLNHVQNLTELQQKDEVVLCIEKDFK